MKQLISILIGTFLCVQLVHGQNKFWNKVTVRKNYESKTSDDSKPAIFSFALPKDSSSSWLFNGGVGLDLMQNKTKTLGLTGFAVYNKNTLVEKKQKNYKAGLEITNVYERNGKGFQLGIFGNSTIQYLHNYIDTTHNAILTSYWNPLYKNEEKGVFIGGYGSTDGLFTYNFLPQVGLEYQNIINAKNTQKKGYDTRVFFNVGINVLLKKKSTFSQDEIKSNVKDFLLEHDTTLVWAKKPLAEASSAIDTIVKHIDSLIRIKQFPKQVKEIPKRQWPKLIELSVSYTGRQAFLSHNSNFEKYIPLLTAGINFYPLKSEDFSIGLSYNNGANPIDGTLKQTFWLFSIAFKK